MSDQIKNRFIRWDNTADGNNSRVIPANYTPTAYVPAQVGSEGADKISSHLNGINTTLTTLQNLPPDNVIKVQKNPGPGQFSSIAAAVASITDASSSNIYKIEVEPGVYTEPQIDAKPYVHIWGSVIGTVVVEPAGDHDVFTVGDNTSLGQLTIQNAPSGRRGIFAVGAETGTTLYRVSIFDCDIGIEANATAASNVDSYLYTEYVDISGGSESFKCISENGNTSFASMENFWAFADDNGQNPTTAIHVSGAGSRVIGQAVKLEGADNTGSGISVTDGARVEFSATTITGFGTGFAAPNVGTGSVILADLTVYGCTADIDIAHPGSTGSLSGSADYSKVSINPNAAIGAAYNNNSSANAGLVVTRSLLQGDRHDRLLNLSLLARTSTTLGQLDGGVMSVNSGLDLDVSSGYGFLLDQSGDFVKQVDWSAQVVSLADNSVSYILVNDGGTVIASSSIGSFVNFIILGKVITYGGQIVDIERSVVKINHYSNRVEFFVRDALGPIFSAGSVVAESGTRNLNITSGRYFYGSSQFNPSGGTPVTFATFHRDGGSGYTRTANQTIVDNANYDNGSGTLQALSSGNYAKHSLYLLGDGADERYFLVYAQSEYTSLVSAEGADIPIPPTSFNDATVLIATIIVQEGSANLIQVRDERPVIGFKASGVSASSSHGNLFGLLDDDHPQYLLASGSRAMAGSLDMGGNNIGNVGTVDGVDVSAHAARHLPNGADALASAAAVSVVPNNTNGIGTANSFSRSDHTHALPTAVASGLTPDQANAIGTANSVSRSDHVHNIPTASAVGIDGDSSSTQGNAATFARSNHTHAIATGVVSGQVPDQSNAEGSSANLARADHVHNIPTEVAVTIGTANAQGAAATFARSDHVHAHGDQTVGSLHAAVTTTVNGFMSAADKVKLNRMDVGYLQYSNSSTQTTSSTTFSTLTLDTDRFSFTTTGRFTKTTTTDFRADFNGTVRISYRVDPYSDTNDRGWEIGVFLNGNLLPYTTTRANGKNVTGRSNSTAMTVLVDVATNDIITLHWRSIEGALITLNADQALMNVSVERLA